MSERSKKIAPVHRSLANLLIRLQEYRKPRGGAKNRQLIITTNPDVTLERTMLVAGVPFTRIVQNLNTGTLQMNSYTGFSAVNDKIQFPGRNAVSIEEGWTELDSIIAEFGPSEKELNPQELSLENLAGPILYKLRESYDYHATSALSIDQYLKFHIRAAEKNLIPKRISEIVQQTPIIMLNYSFLDPDYRLVSYTLLEKAREATRDPIYALHTPAVSGWPERELWERLKNTVLEERRITTIEEEGHVFLERLNGAIQ